MSFATFTPFFDLLNLKAKAECLLLRILSLLLFNFEAMCIPGKGLNDCLFMFSNILTMISAIMTITVLITEYFFLKAFTVQLQTLWSFAVASYFFLSNHYVFLLSINWRKNVGITSFTALGKRRGRVSYRVLYWKALIISLFERFPERLWIQRILCLYYRAISFWILSRTLISHLWRNQTFVGTGTVEHFAKVFFFEQMLVGFVLCQSKCFLRDDFNILDLLNGKLLK